MGPLNRASRNRPPRNEERFHAVRALVSELIDQRSAHVIVRPNRAADGYWFGGGNLLQDAGGTLWLVGRYRDAGDSRTGLGAGERGLACALFASADGGASFEPVRSWSKAELSAHGTVLSIEGTDLRRRAGGGVELFVSLEKDVPYPDAYAAYQKPGTGVWSIDRMTATRRHRSTWQHRRRCCGRGGRSPSTSRTPSPSRPRRGHGAAVLLASGLVGLQQHRRRRARGSATTFELASWEAVARGAIWTSPSRASPTGSRCRESACCVRAADERLLLRRRGVHAPAGGEPAGRETAARLLLRGARRRDVGPGRRLPGDGTAVDGRAALRVADRNRQQSLREHLLTKEFLYATWQQSQADRSQPLVMNALPMERVEAILSGDA